MNRKIFIYANDTENSKKTEKKLRQKLDKSGFTVIAEYSPDADLLVCIGGDGTFLEAVHKFNFPPMPTIGINTGHLGFFQEIMPSMLDDFIFNYTQQKYSIQQLSTVKVRVLTDDGAAEHVGLNEVLIKGNASYSIHLNISIGGSFIERFSGDGLLIATPAGSTGYTHCADEYHCLPLFYIEYSASFRSFSGRGSRYGKRYEPSLYRLRRLLGGIPKCPRNRSLLCRNLNQSDAV